ncbi:MAG: hypothetical protein HDS82_03425 [Bacteroidales bacterium]|nr:hypothetical protein [Bacteroidales bacterium]
MRTVILILLIAIGWSHSYSENWFVENARWYVSYGVVGLDDTIDDFYGEIVELRKSPEAEDGSLEMICTKVARGQRVGEETFIAFIRVEDDKVYFKDVWNWDKWYLMYDFSITLHKSADVWEVKTEEDSNKYPTLVDLFCYKMFQTENPEIRIASVIDSSYSYKYSYNDCWMDFLSGYWILGIGSTEGPIKNCGYGVAGEWKQRLLRFEVGDEIIYEYDLIAGIPQNRQDDQSTVDQSSPKYGLDGRLLPPDADGLYIQNGRLHLNRSR